jgi:hypothetical protein
MIDLLLRLPPARGRDAQQRVPTSYEKLYLVKLKHSLEKKYTCTGTFTGRMVTKKYKVYSKQLTAFNSFDNTTSQLLIHLKIIR